MGEPDDKLPPMNAALEEMLAHVAYDDAEGRPLMLRVWIMLGFEYYAREFGRREADRVARDAVAWIRDSKPTKEWPK